MLTLVITLALAAPANADLARAETSFAAFKYDDALTALKKAEAVTGNDRTTVLRILELRGICAGQLRQARVAETAFTTLMVLDPGHQLPAEYAPRVMTPFLEARRLAADKGALALEPAEPVVADGRVQVLSVKVRDSLALVRQLRFHLSTDGSPWRVVSAPVQLGVGRLEVDGETVRWFVEALGASDAVLQVAGADAQPLVATAKVAAPSPTPAAPTVTDRAPEPTSSGGGVRLASYGVLAGGAIALGVGIVFGVQSGEIGRRIAASPRDADGRITGFTEREAAEANARSQQSAVIANVLFGAAAGLAIAGALMWWFGGPSDTAVSVVPSFNGMALVGALP